MQQGWVRNALAIVAGILAGGVCVMLVEMIAHSVVTGEALFAAAIVALFVGVLGGGALAVRIASRALFGCIVAAALGLLSLINVLAFAHPAWFVPAAAVTLAIGGWLTTRTLPRRAALP